MPIKVHPSFHVHPGVWLRDEVVDQSGFKVAHLADRLHVTRQALSTLLNGRARLSEEMAIRFEKAFGVDADTLLRMQSAHALAKAREHEADILVDPVRELA